MARGKVSPFIRSLENLSNVSRVKEVAEDVGAVVEEEVEAEDRDLELVDQLGISNATTKSSSNTTTN